MSKNIGTLVGAPVRINDSLDTYPVALQQEIKGGHHSKLTVDEMEALGAHLRVAGMTCYVAANGNTYELSNDLTLWKLKTSTVPKETEPPAPGTGGDSTTTTIISGNFGAWTNIPAKSASIFDEQLAIQYKLDLSAFPTRAIVYLVGQFGLNSAFSGTEITLGTLPVNARPKANIKKYMICQNIEMYLVVLTTGAVKLVSKDGLNLPVTDGGSEANPYYIDLFFNPDIAAVTVETFTYTRTANFTRICDAGYAGNVVPFSKDYTSNTSLQDATDIANADPNYDALGQAFANANGTCTIVDDGGSSGGDGGETYKRFTLEQTYRRLVLQGDEPIECNLTVNISYSITNRDSEGENPVTTGPFETTITLTAGETFKSTGSLIGLGLYDTINVLAFSITPQTCGSDTILINSLPFLGEI